MSNRGRTNNSRYRKEILKKEAIARQEYRNSLSAVKQLERLDARFADAKKERTRLANLIKKA